MTKSSILIGTPCYGGLVHVHFMHSIMALLMDSSPGKPNFEVQTITTADLSTARNAMASNVINDDQYSHVLFLDADQGFTPRLIGRMLDFDKPVVGALVPHKAINHEQVFRAAKQSENADMMSKIMLDYVGARMVESTKTAPGESTIKVDRGFVRINGIGTGILLVTRAALLKLKDTFPELWLHDRGHQYRDKVRTGGVLQCFAPLSKGREFMSEDMSFMSRWTAGCGGEVWACIDEEVAHIGLYEFRGKYIDRLKAGMPQNYQLL